MFLAFLGFVNVYALRVNLSVAIVSMAKQDMKNHTNECVAPNSSDVTYHHDDTDVRLLPLTVAVELKLLHASVTIFFICQKHEFSWDSQLQTLILGSFFYGYIVTQVIIALALRSSSWM